MSDESPWDKVLASNASEIVDDPDGILRSIRRASLDTKLVEVEFPNRSRIFFSNLVEGPMPEDEAAYLHQLKEFAALVEGAQPPILPRYSYDYLEKKRHFFLSPLMPQIGNNILANCSMLLLRFFHGVKALEVPAAFLGSLDIGEDHLLKLAFPMRLFIFAKRRHFRATAAPFTLLLVTVTPENKKIPSITTKVMNISASGLAFCNPLGFDVPPVGQKAQLSIQPEDMPPIIVDVIVRNHAPATPKEGCGKQQSRCGVQFELTSQEQAMRIEELVASVQRLVIAMVSETRPTAKPVTKKPGEPSALDKLLVEKKKKRGFFG